MSRITANPTVKIFGASHLLRNLKDIQKEIEGVQTSADIEYIHRMRVATRRLRSGINLFGPLLAPKRAGDWQKSVRGLTKALGAARDADVQIEVLTTFLEPLQVPYRSGISRLILRLRQRRAGYQSAVQEAVTTFEKSGTGEELDHRLAQLDSFREYVNPLNTGLQALAYQSINTELQNFLSFEEKVQDPNNVKELHAMRIAAKHLRYTMEFFTTCYENELKTPLKTLRACQDLLGNIHDCDVWITWLPEFSDQERQRTLKFYGTAHPFDRIKPGLDYFLADRQQVRGQMYDEFIHAWQEWAGTQVWENLRETTQETLNVAEALEAEKQASENPFEESASEVPAE